LEDFTPLSDIVAAKGGVGGTSSGVRLSRYIGKSLLETLNRIHGAGFLVRDLSLQSVYLPAASKTMVDGSKVTIGSLLNMGSVNSATGYLSGEAPDLDSAMFSLTSKLCPPEALQVNRVGGGKYSVEFCDLRDGDAGKNVGDVSSSLPSTATWDTWCFGALLFELVTGKKIPSYGSSLVEYLGRSVQGGEDDSGVLSRFHYDWIRVIGESKSVGAGSDRPDEIGLDDEEGEEDTAIETNRRAGLQLSSSILSAVTSSADSESLGTDNSLLASSALLASIAKGFSYRAILPRSALVESSSSGKHSSDQVLEAVRQKWIRLEMSRSDKDEGKCCTWSELVEKMSRHARSIERSLNSGETISGAEVPHALQVLRGLDSAGRGGLAPSVFVENLVAGPDGVHGNGLHYPVTPLEAARLASCATVVLTEDGEREALVAYEAFGSIFSGYPHGGKFGGREDPSSLLLDIIALCLIDDPKKRPTPAQLLTHPFFNLTESESELALNDARGYATGAAPVAVMVQQEVVAPLVKLTEQSAKLALYQQKVDMAVSVGAGNVDGGEHAVTFDVGMFCDVMNSAAGFLHGGGDAALGKEEGSAEGGGGGGGGVGHSSSWAPHERQHAAELMFSDEMIEGGVLPRIVACALRFVSSDQGSMVGYDFPNASAVGGSANQTLGQRLMTRIARFFESVLLETRPVIIGGRASGDGPAAAYVGMVLEALVKLYVGEEGDLAKFYGRGGGMSVDFSGYGGCNVVEDGDAEWGPFGRSSESINHWSPNFMVMIEPVLLLAITESGSGNHLYPAIVDYIVSAKAQMEAGGGAEEEVGGGGGG
jgi:serine/threonine protein kinase